MSKISRMSELRRYFSGLGTAIEVAPYHSPVLEKSSSGNVLIMDVFDAEELRRRAAKDPNLPKEAISNIADVDIIGDASLIEQVMAERDLSGKIEFVVSSHNFEHLPNPILFLQGVSAVLRDGGVLSMAVPDCRTCFDHFRMPTRLCDWLAAFYENRTQPSAETIFDGIAYQATYLRDGKSVPACKIEFESSRGFVLKKDIKTAFDLYRQYKEGEGDYFDMHCNLLFPELLQLLLLDLRWLGLVNLEVLNISETRGHEFFVHLRKSTKPIGLSESQYHEQRQVLVRKVSENLGLACFGLENRIPLRFQTRRSLHRLTGAMKAIKRRIKLPTWAKR